MEYKDIYYQIIVVDITYVKFNVCRIMYNVYRIRMSEIVLFTSSCLNTLHST